MTEQDRHGDDSDWIFAGADPGTLPTERLPGRDEFERFSSPLTATGQIPALPEAASSETPASPEQTPGAVAPERESTYARSGTTPDAEHSPPAPRMILPSRFAELSWWDAARDVVAFVSLVAAYGVPFTSADVGRWLLVPRLAAVVGLAALLAAHLLRWIPATPPLRVIRVLRIAGTIPAVLVALTAIVADAVLSLPVLFSPLPDGPPLGIGVGVALLLLGGLLGAEPRRHEDFVPGERAKARTRRLLLGIAAVAALFLAVALVMIVGRFVTTGWPFGLRVLADTGVSALLLVLVIGAGLRWERSRYVFASAAVAGLVLGALADNSLRLQFALPRSVATGYVYLPLLFAAFGVMLSRSFVRTMGLSFRRADWIVYAVRALEFSTVMHIAAAAWSVIAAIASAGGYGWGGPVLHAIDAVLSVAFAALSAFGRRALLERSADSARATAVVASVVMVVVGFLDVIVNSLASGAGAGLVTGGVALVIGVAVALMLTVPAPVRDEYGAPDLVQMFEDFRRRNGQSRSLLARVPDVRDARSAKKSFPGR